MGRSNKYWLVVDKMVKNTCRVLALAVHFHSCSPAFSRVSGGDPILLAPAPNLPAALGIKNSYVSHHVSGENKTENILKALSVTQ